MPARRFRHATMRDFPQMQKIYAHARELMARSGNPTQWGTTFPKEEVVLDDIANHRTMLLVDRVDGRERILAQFALCPGEDPTYRHIDGAWLDNDAYVTIHRIASSGLVKGAAKDCIACGQCEGVCPQHLPIIQLLQEAAEKLERRG